MSFVSIAGRQVGSNRPAYIIAEIGGNFKTLAEGFEEIDLAVAAGADAVKIQTFRADTLVTKDSRFSTIAQGANQYELFRDLEISEEWHIQLAARAAEKKLHFFSTPSHQNDVDLLERIQVPVYKTGSDDLTNLPLLDYIARKGKPMIVSTGMSSLEEVTQAVNTIKGAGNNQIILLHCVSGYPVTADEDLNLRAIRTLEKAFGVPVGFSDHTEGCRIPLLAVTAGACIIEKHFVLSKDLGTPDAFFSADPAELKELVTGIRDLEVLLGTGEKIPTEAEIKLRRDARKSIVARRNISTGEKLTPDNIAVKRPGTGISPSEWNQVLGRQAAVDIPCDSVLNRNQLA